MYTYDKLYIFVVVFFYFHTNYDDDESEYFKRQVFYVE